jgi:hypothetical protein
MRRTVFLLLLPFVVCTPVYGQLLTFDEPEALRLMTIKATHTPAAEYWSAKIPEWTGPGVTLTAMGERQFGGLPSFYLRTRYLAQSPDEYMNIGGSILQMDSDILRIDLTEPTDFFGFGAALNSAPHPGQMTIELFDADGLLLATRTLDLYTTNGSPEGRFLIAGTPGIQTAIITNHGDPNAPESRFGWVIDNLAYARPPALPAGMVLFLVEGATPPGGFTLVGEVQSMLHPAGGGRSVRLTYGVYVKR